MTESDSFLRTIPQDLSVIMGMVVNNWKKTNPEAIRKIYEWHTKNENFLFKSKQEQIDYMERKGFVIRNDNKQQLINEQVTMLKRKGMLTHKRLTNEGK